MGRKNVDGAFEPVLMTQHLRAGRRLVCLTRNGLAFLGHIHFIPAQTRPLFYKYTKFSCCTRHLFTDTSILSQAIILYARMKCL